MKFNAENVITTVNVSKKHSGEWGYFSNSLYDLKLAVEKNHSTMKCIYTRLLAILPDNREHRFCTDVANFALFYPVSLTENEELY